MILPDYCKAFVYIHSTMSWLTTLGFSYVCLFVWGLSSHSRLFHSYGDVTIIGEGLQILTYARHSWPVSSKFFIVPHLLWHGVSVYNDHIRGPVTLTHIAELQAVELSLPFLRLRSVVAGIRTPNLLFLMCPCIF